jgi:DNA-binding transcriptional LysR family regulator
MSLRTVDHARFSLGRLRSFLKVYDAGSIAAAARQTPNAVAQQSQLSRQLSDLRAVFGTELFEGVGRDRRPTPFGRSLARLVRDFEDGLEALRAGLMEEPLVCTVGAGNSVLHWLLLPHLHEVNDLLPAAIERRVRWQPAGLDNDEVKDRVADGRLDLGIVYGPRRGPGEPRIKLGTFDLRLFAPRRLRGEAPPWKVLAQSAPLAAVTTEPHIEDAIAGLGVEVRSRCDTWPQVASAVRTGRWVGVLPHIARVELPEEEFWSVAVPSFKELSTPLYLTTRPRLEEVRPDVHALRDPVAKVLSQALRSGSA